MLYFLYFLVNNEPNSLFSNKGVGFFSFINKNKCCSRFKNKKHKNNFSIIEIYNVKNDKQLN